MDADISDIYVTRSPGSARDNNKSDVERENDPGN